MTKHTQFDDRDFLDDTFKVGQVWKYNTRKNEENSTIKILKIEKYEKTGIVIHISASNVRVKNPYEINSFYEELEHFPLSKNAILNSVTSLISEENILPDYKDGYNTWKEEFDNKTGGIFSIPIKEAIQYFEEAISDSKERSN